MPRPSLCQVHNSLIEDVKGYSGDTPVYRLKRKLVEALYNITITEIGGTRASLPARKAAA